jgi:hypothetical protein
MFRLFRQKPHSAVKREDPVAHQVPGETFSWPKGIVLTALDQATIALPMALFGKDEPIGSVVLGSDDIEMNIPKEGDTFYIRLQPGMSVSLAKSCQARVVADDAKPRRFRLMSPTPPDA